MLKKIAILVLTILMLFSITACADTPEPTADPGPAPAPAPEEPATPDAPDTNEDPVPVPADGKMTFALVPKSTGAPYFIACEKGAALASEDLGVEYIWTGPTSEDSARQIAIIEDLITQGVDALIISPVDGEACVDVINRAMEAGIPTFTWDMDSGNSDRLFCVTAGHARESGFALADGMAKEIGEEGQVAILTGSLGSDVLARRVEAVEERLADYPNIEVVAIEATDEDLQKGITAAENLLQAYPDLAGFVGVSAGNALMAATAIHSSGRQGVAVWSLGLPSTTGDFVKDGTVKGMMLWDPGAMTYIAMAAAKQYIEEGVLPVDGQDYGPYAGSIVVNEGETVAYVPSLVFTPENIDEFIGI